MDKYFHSVTLDKDLCKGCTNCLKHCPTEAIRIRNSKAKIIKELCIDCGECIRICPYHAKKAITDEYEKIFDYKYKIALPAPAFYAQYNDVNIEILLYALKLLGFDEIREITVGADIVSAKTNELLSSNNIEKPLISSSCPAIVRLIKIRFPSLIPNILPFQSPLDIIAKKAKFETAEKLSISHKDVGVFFISPCAAKVTSSKVPIGIPESYVDGVISIAKIVQEIAPFYSKLTESGDDFSQSTASGIGWAKSGGESHELHSFNSIAVDGVKNVIKLLEDLEDDKITDIDFIECCACTGGCVGGPLTVNNTYVSQANIRKLIKKYQREPSCFNCNEEDVSLSLSIERDTILKLGSNMSESIKMMEAIDKLAKKLPGLDCGSCGAPSCSALAEDVVKGYAKESDCIFIYKEKLKTFMNEMNLLKE
ncbi:MAG: 4Fe-4S binding protein [Clostridia bacterium]|nr:4Fe-4S binding protein [Clostridia bacterium]